MQSYANGQTDSLEAWIRDVLEAAGSSAEISEVVARSLVSADL